MEVRENPFRHQGQWWWRDDEQVAHGPFPTQVNALRGLLKHCDKRGRWVILKELWQEFVAA